MTVHVKLFAILRDRAGIAETSLELPDNATVHDATQKLGDDHSAIKPYLSKVAFAINEQYAPATSVLRHGDELALIPPVSGGSS